MAGERLQCVLSRAGVDSRRHCASIIAGGAVTVDGVVVREPGFRVEDPDAVDIRVNGRRVAIASDSAPRRRVVVLNKPRGFLCTRAEGPCRTIYDLLSGVRERLVSAGRLDRDSEGLIILTNDGDLVNRLTHPRHGHEKVYRVQASGIFDDETLAGLQSPMSLDGVPLAPVRVEYEQRLADGPYGPRHRLVFRLREGRNRQIRRMCEEVGLRVETLRRVAVNAFRLPADLRSGEWRDLTARELELLERAPRAPLRPWSPNGEASDRGSAPMRPSGGRSSPSGKARGASR